MSNNYIFSFIIGYRHDPSRIHQLRKVISWASSFIGVDLIIVEEDNHSKIDYLGLPGRHIFIKNDGAYNKGWSWNVGVSHSKSDIIVLCDSDLIMEPNAFIQALSELNEYDMISPYSRVIDLDPNESYLPIEELLKIDKPGRGETDNQQIIN